MFSFFSTSQTPTIESRFSSCARLKPLFDLIELFRIQIDKLNVAMSSSDDDDAKIARLKYDVLKPLLDNMDEYIKYFNNVPQEAQNDMQDIKCLLEAISHAVNKIDVVKRNFLSLARGVSNDDKKKAGFGFASLGVFGAYAISAVSLPVAIIATALIVDAGVRTSNQEGPKTRSLEILVSIEEMTERILHEVNRELESSLSYASMKITQ